MHHTAERPLFIEMIRSSQHEYNKRARKAGRGGQVPEAEPGKNLFEIHTGNQWLELEKHTPRPKMLFGEFWYQGELCILFADTNAGKSVLAVQIGESLARRQAINGLGLEAEQCNVLYVDFELSGKQFQARYTTPQGALYDFSNGFFRAGFNPNATMPPNFATYDEYMNNALEYAVKRTGADVLIIDNITCLRSGTERAADALPLMKHLKALKTKHQLSILVLAHTPKRNYTQPLDVNDLQGSKMLINFADSAFAIGTSNANRQLRYLKQVKQRNTEQVYGPQNVCLCRLSKTGSFLQFEYLETARERDHLRPPNSQQRRDLADRIAAMLQQGHTQRYIARELNMSTSSVNRYARLAEED